MRVRSAFAALLALFSGQVLAQKTLDSRLTFYGSVGVEAEDYQYESEYGSRDRTRLRTRFDLNGRGFIWDPRFATYDAGITLQRENVQTSDNDASGNASYNMLGYRLNTTWFANKPYPLNIYASRSQNTTADFWSPSYELTTSVLGARWGMDNRWLGRTSAYVDRSSSESSSSLVPRSEQRLSFGIDGNKKLLPKQWGESDMSYGYRHTAWDEMAYGSSQRQDYFYLNDRTLFGDKANLTANVTYYDRSDQWGGMGNGLEWASSFFGLNSMLNIQQSENFRHYYGLGFGLNKFGDSQSASQNLSGGVNYRFNEQWQANATLGLSTYRTESAVEGESLTQDGSSTSGSAGVLYSSKFGNYLVNGGYTVALMRSDATVMEGSQRGQQNATHTVNLGYTRTNSPLYADSLQLRLSQTVGEPSGSEANIRYSVTSALTAKDMLQGVAEYRRYQQEYRVWTNVVSAYDYYYYGLDSQTMRLDFGWLHRFSEANSVMLSAGATSGESQGIALDTRYAQARATMRLRSALHWTALARAEQIEGLASIAGRKVTLESDLNYRIGKWQAGVRYRLRDAQLEFAPFREKSLMLLLRRDYDFRL